MKPLRLNVRRQYFEEAKAGTKRFEYRLCNEYWRKRLEGKEFSEIIYCLGYPAKHETEKMLHRPWRFWHIEMITHKEFGPHPVAVFAIPINP